MKKNFTLVHSIGNKNISALFAGGSHSWIIIDDDHPIKHNPKVNLRSTIKFQSAQKEEIKYGPDEVMKVK